MDGSNLGEREAAARAYEARIEALEGKLRALAETTGGPAGAGAAAGTQARTSWRILAERWGLLIAWALLILVIGAFKPDQMFTWNSYASMFGSNATILVLTLALLLPLMAGDFDLSVAATMGLAAMLTAVLSVHLGMSVWGAAVLAILTGGLIGGINAFFILYFGIHSLIVTLGLGYATAGVILWVSDSATIFGQQLQPLADVVILSRILGIAPAFWYAVILTAALWWVFQHTALGRRLLFVGRGREVARLSGVDVVRMRAGALVASGMIAAFAGVLSTGSRMSADPTSALSLLLPAFAAAFLGSTTLYPGRFNAPGAFVAVFFLTTGVMGLNFLGADSFVQNLFYGGGLVLAVSISQLIRGRRPMD